MSVLCATAFTQLTDSTLTEFVKVGVNRTMLRPPDYGQSAAALSGGGTP
jgi:hypothetical protein